jgi:hypothetical protein
MQQDALLTPSALRAAVRLLVDDDAKVHGACRRRLLAFGEGCRVELERAATAADPRLRIRARAVLRSLDLEAWVQDFVGAIRSARFGLQPCGLLATGLAALVRFPALEPGDAEDFGRRLAALTDELRPLGAARSSLTAARRLSDLLARRHDLNGARVPSKGHDTWLPDRVLASGRGPSSVLAAIYLLVARGAGIEATGVRLPDFVLVRVHGRRRILLDPYHRGRTVTKADCMRYLRRILPARPLAEQLADVADAEILDSVVEDLILVHDRPEDGEFRDALRRARVALTPGRELWLGGARG